MKLWIARDLDGSLALYEIEPKYEEKYDTWLTPCGLPFYISEHLFPEVTFENSPMEVELVIKK